MPGCSGLRVDIRCVFDARSWWRIDWLLYLYTVKDARPRGLPLLRINM
jgi:hypothetical protein